MTINNIIFILVVIVNNISSKNKQIYDNYSKNFFIVLK